MSVLVVDYGLGNLRSVLRALEHEGGSPQLVSTPTEIESAERILLPGVGAFADGMRGLAERSLVEPLLEYLRSGRPFLGICLGMQMLFEEAEEFGLHRGLGAIPGSVRRIPERSITGEPLKVPHIGWSPLVYPERVSGERWRDTVLADIPEQSAVYFVHSYAGIPADREHRLADTVYNGERILAAVQKGNVFGCQFHPEKSGPIGLAVLRRFLAI